MQRSTDPQVGRGSFISGGYRRVPPKAGVCHSCSGVRCQVSGVREGRLVSGGGRSQPAKGAAVVINDREGSYLSQLSRLRCNQSLEVTVCAGKWEGGGLRAPFLFWREGSRGLCIPSINECMMNMTNIL